MRVVLDSNVIVAAFATRGMCSALFEYCVENHDVVLCEHMLDEIERALVRKVGVPRSVVREVLEYLRDQAETVSPAAVDSRVCRDESDLPVLGAAVGAGCEYIITGDAHLLSVGRHGAVRIVSPRAFWEKMKRGKHR
jgi:putative PIN family toxin of toxin-antitoxin system